LNHGTLDLGEIRGNGNAIAASILIAGFVRPGGTLKKLSQRPFPSTPLREQALAQIAL
jgi:hypothetical protein